MCRSVRFAVLLALAWGGAAFGQGLNAEGMILSPSMQPGRTVPIWQMKPFDRFQCTDPAKTWIDIEPDRLPEDFDDTGFKPGDSVPTVGLPTKYGFRKDIWYRFRAVADGGRYEVIGSGIFKIELFEEIVNGELAFELAKDVTPEKIKFDDGVEDLRVLREREPFCNLQKLTKLKESAKFNRVRYHAAEAAAGMNRADYPRVFECLEAERRARLLIPADAKVPTEVANLAPLDRRADLCADNWLRVVMGSARFDEGRRIVARLEATYPKSRVAETARRDYDRLVRGILDRARQSLAAGFVPKAYDLLDEAVLVQPDHPELRAEMAKLAKSHPRLRVAVAELPGYRLGPAAWTPADHRAAAILHEPMARLTGYKPDGSAVFESRLLSAIRDEDDLNRKVSVEVAPGLAWPGDGKPVTPVDAQRLFALARERGSALYHPALELLLTNVQARPPKATLMEFDRPQFQARMWLQTPLFRMSVDPTANNSVAGLGWQGLGPFRAYDRALNRVQFVANPRFVAPGEPTVKLLNEVRIPKPEDRFRALEYGAVDLVEFVPWRNAALAANVPNARLVRESVPKAHVLQFNYGRDLLRMPNVRRAIALALDRPAIFKAVGIAPTAGDCPLANAATVGALGNDPKAELWPYDPIVARILVAAAKKEVNAPAAPLTLSHQGNESTRRAVEQIAKQLNAAGFEVTIVQVDDRNPDPRAADLRYEIAAPTEAVFDLVTLLTRDNPSLFEYATPGMRALLVELLQVSSATKALALLPRIHAAVRGDVALVPLWQWHDQFLVSESVRNLPAKPHSVYDGVTRWDAEPRYPPAWWETQATSAGANR